MKIRELRFLVVAALVALGLGLAGCGGSSKKATPMPPDTGTTPMPDDPAIAQRAAINKYVTAASTAVAGLTDDASDTALGSAESAVAAAKKAIMDASAVPDAEKAAFNTTIAVVEGDLSAKKASRTAAMAAADKARMAAMAKAGKALHAALGPPDSSLNNLGALNNQETAIVLRTDGLYIDPAPGAGALPSTPNIDQVTLKAGDSAESLGGWMGTDYALTTGTGDSKVTYEARVYTNRGAGKSVAFGDVHTVITDAGANKGYVAVSNDSNLSRVRAPAFTHSGTQTHTKADRADAVYLRGTYDGAPGEYRCTGVAACTSTNDGSGSVSGLAGTWHFKPDSGAMVSQPDTNYLYFGWWVSKDKDGGPTAASAFHNVVGDVDGSADPPDPTQLTGSATYAGKAAGKFAMSNPLDGTGNGGHFTADVALSAKFGSNDAPNNGGVTGTIDNFRLNDGSADPGWSVELKRGPWGGPGTIGRPGENQAGPGTVWSIDGNAAPASGNWQGEMYDEKPGNPPDGDGSNIPTTVLGRFYSEFSTFGRMAGAFGAEKQ